MEALKKKRIPVCRRIAANGLDPMRMLKKLRCRHERVFMLEHASETESGPRWERYSYICFDPAAHYSYADGVMTVCEGGKDSVFPCPDPYGVLRNVMEDNACRGDASLPPFFGGLTGYLAFESIECAEPGIRFACPNVEGYKDLDFMLMDKVCAFDRETDEILIIYSGYAADREEALSAAESVFAETERILRKGDEYDCPLRLRGEVGEIFSKARHIENVKAAKRRILRGDVSQVVISNGNEAEAEGDLLGVYALLRRRDKTKHMCYFSSDDLVAAVASPGTILHISGGKAVAECLAGTAPRGRDRLEDAAFEQQLLCDPKAAAEHNMLVDDTRNEFGAFSKPGTIRVREYQKVVRCAAVMHLSSTVESELAHGVLALDALGGIVPAGVVSGAPKIAACEIISETEGDRRGIYGSAMGYMGFDGNAGFFSFIHAVWLKNGKVFARAGGGIVADSDPEEEYEECICKTGAMVQALRAAGGNRQQDPSTGREDKMHTRRCAGDQGHGADASIRAENFSGPL